MMEKNRNNNPGKLIAWAQTRSATKGSKQAGPYCVLEFILTLPSPGIKGPSILIVFSIKVHSSE